jgi:hypothetical protein
MTISTLFRRKLCALFAQTGTTIFRKAELLEKRNALRCRIIKWREVQMVYMPGAEQIIARVKSTASTEQLDHAELENLLLPSSISHANSMLGCILGLADKECRLRLAQADDALNELRRQLRVTSSILVFKRGQHSASQRLSRTTQGLMDRFRDKTLRCAQRYSAAFAALSVLDPGGNWTQRLQKLDHSKDLQLPRREEDPKKKKGRMAGENRRELSWIWLTPKVGSRQSDVVMADKINDCEYSVTSRSLYSRCGHNAV